MSHPDDYMPWRDETVLDIIGDNIYYDRLDAEKEGENE